MANSKEWYGGHLPSAPRTISDTLVRVDFHGALPKGVPQSKHFPFAKFDGSNGAMHAATAWRDEQCRVHGIVAKNRLCRLPNGDIEMELTQGKTMLLLEVTLASVLPYTWSANQGKSGNWYAGAWIDGRMVKAHRHITHEQGWTSVDHIDGNGLNNRLENLRDGTEINPRNCRMLRTNKSGVNGVCERNDRNRYQVQWHEEGRRRLKWFSFGPRSKRTKEEAFELAKAFRKKMDERTGTTNGARPTLPDNERRRKKPRVASDGSENKA